MIHIKKFNEKFENIETELIEVLSNLANLAEREESGDIVSISEIYDIGYLQDLHDKITTRKVKRILSFATKLVEDEIEGNHVEIRSWLDPIEIRREINKITPSNIISSMPDFNEIF